MRGAILLRAFQHPPEGLTGAGCTVVMYGTKVVRKETKMYEDKKKKKDKGKDVTGRASMELRHMLSLTNTENPLLTIPSAMALAPSVLIPHSSKESRSSGAPCQEAPPSAPRPRPRSG
jgi:hypothetical protein